MGNVTRLYTAAAILLILSSRVWAANSVSIGAVTANAGDSVTVPVSVTTDQEMTLLSVDITTDPALCGMIDHQAVIKGPAANKDPEEGGEQCPTTRVVLFDLSAAPVIKPGSGVIAEWTFNVRPDAPGGVFPLRVSVSHSRNGPATVPLTSISGQLTVMAQEGAAQGSQPAPAVGGPEGGQAAAPLEPRVGAPVEPGTTAPEAKAGAPARQLALGAAPPTPLPDGGSAAGGLAAGEAPPIAGTARPTAEPGGAAPATPESKAPQPSARAEATAVPQPPATPRVDQTPSATTVPQAPTMTVASMPTRTLPFSPTVPPTPERTGSCAIAPLAGCFGISLLVAAIALAVRRPRKRQRS